MVVGLSGTMEQELIQLELLCCQLYESTDAQQRTKAEEALVAFTASPDCLTKCHLLLDRSEVLSELMIIKFILNLILPLFPFISVVILTTARGHHAYKACLSDALHADNSGADRYQELCPAILGCQSKAGPLRDSSTGPALCTHHKAGLV